MNVRFLLGPAGSGKTFRCLGEIRKELLDDPLGEPLILLAPRQATYQLELQLLSVPGLDGYTRLQIVSFERFAVWLLEQLGEPPLRVLTEEGRIMVLRALLERHHGELHTFGGCSRLSGFAQLLSEQLREVQQCQVSVSALRETADQLSDLEQTKSKLLDLALVLEHFQSWLQQRELPDAGTLLDHAVAKLREHGRQSEVALRIAGLWLDGVAELTPQEIELIVALAPFCRDATLAFCLESEPKEEPHWLSSWSVIGQTFRRIHTRIRAAEDCATSVEVIGRAQKLSRFSSPMEALEEQDSVIRQQLDLFQSDADSSKALA
jgi:ATP-dependent helicase/nuclease subunit B